MERLIVEIESTARAKELLSMLAALSFVKRVTAVTNSAALQDDESVVMNHIREGLQEGQQILAGKIKPLTRDEFKAVLKA